MNEPEMETIRKAILKHRGGLKGASDTQIKIIWDSLDERTRQAYLAKTKPAKERKAKDATGYKS